MEKKKRRYRILLLDIAKSSTILLCKGPYTNGIPTYIIMYAPTYIIMYHNLFYNFV